MVSGSGDKTLRVWDAASGKCVLGPLEGHMNNVMSVAFSPDGTPVGVDLSQVVMSVVFWTPRRARACAPAR